MVASILYNPASGVSLSELRRQNPSARIYTSRSAFDQARSTARSSSLRNSPNQNQSAAINQLQQQSLNLALYGPLGAARRNLGNPVFSAAPQTVTPTTSNSLRSGGFSGLVSAYAKLNEQIDERIFGGRFPGGVTRETALIRKAERIGGLTTAEDAVRTATQQNRLAELEGEYARREQEFRAKLEREQLENAYEIQRKLDDEMRRQAQDLISVNLLERFGIGLSSQEQALRQARQETVYQQQLAEEAQRYALSSAQLQEIAATGGAGTQAFIEQAQTASEGGAPAFLQKYGGWILLAVGGVILFAMMRKKRK